jgi:hypothetical protein
MPNNDYLKTSDAGMLCERTLTGGVEKALKKCRLAVKKIIVIMSLALEK